MAGRYWLDLFTGLTWEEFLAHGANASGFRERRKALCTKIEPGDYFICYLTGVSRFVGVLQVESKCYYDTSPIWTSDIFPIRFRVEPITILSRPKPPSPLQN